MKSSKVVLIVVACTSTSMAMASSIECSNKNIDLKYVRSQSDGGAHIGHSELLIFGKRTLIEKEQMSGPHEYKIKLVDYRTMGPTIEEVNFPPVKDYKKTQFYQNVLITSDKEPADIVYSGTVFCEVNTYVGPPRP